MAKWYCDHGSTLYPTAYMATPANASQLPQEGDGKATGAIAPASAVATMDFASATAAAGATLLVMGATLTCVASAATTNQFNAAAGSTLATNIAAAINAATAATTTTTGGLASPYLKGLVWAVASGTVVSVYTRIASADLNTASNASCIISCGATANWTSPPANSSFAGGVSGPWASFFNTAALAAAINASVSAVGTHGAYVATMMGAPAAGDFIFLRTKRAGSNVTLTWPTSTAAVTGRAVGTLANPLFIVTDNGVEWPGDAGVFIMSADVSLTASRVFALPNINGLKHIFQGAILSDSTRNWRHELTGVPANGYRYSFGAATSSSLSYAEVSAMEFGGAAGGFINNADQTWLPLELTGSMAGINPVEIPNMALRDVIVRQRSRLCPFALNNSSYQYNVYAERCLFDYTGITAAATSAVAYIVSSGGGRLEYASCKWVGLAAQANLSGMQGSVVPNRGTTLIMRDCDYPNLKLSGGAANGGLTGITSSTTYFDILNSISVSSTVGTRNFIFENTRRSFAWVDSAAPKTASSKLPDGVTGFSVRTAVTTEVGQVSKHAPVVFPRMSKINSLPDGDRTAKLRILVDNNIKSALGRDPLKDEMWIIVSYVGTDLTTKRVSSRASNLTAAASLSAGSAGDWSAVAYDVNGVSHNYTPYEITVFCPAVEGGTELSLEYVQGVQTTSVDNIVFIEPEWSLT